MKRAAFGLLLAVVVTSSTGCCVIDRLFHCNRGIGGGGCSSGCDSGYGGGPGGGCSSCGGQGGYAGEGLHGGGGYADAGPPGPPSAQVTYPYYTTRGPRDFLASNPRDIGP